MCTRERLSGYERVRIAMIVCYREVVQETIALFMTGRMYSIW